MRWLILLFCAGAALAADAPDALVEQSARAFASGDFAQAAESAERAIRLRPDDPRAYNNLCAACNAQAQWDRAAQAGKRAVQLDPADALARNNLAWAQAHGPEVRRDPATLFAVLCAIALALALIAGAADLTD